MGQINDDTEIPETIYHYCSETSFQGILKSKQLWLSDVHCMNDSTEQKWLIGKAERRLNELNHGDLWRDIQPIIINLHPMDHNPHAFCFSPSPDSLSQWRAYADDGNGYSIGFSSSWLKNQKKTHGRYVALWKVEYDEKEQMEGINHYIDKYLASLNRGADRAEAGMTLVLAIYALSAICKNPHFHEEQEIRLLVLEPRDCTILHDGCRQGISARFYRKNDKYDEISCFSLDFPENAITSIYLGPKNNAKNDGSKLRNFLTENGYDVNKLEIHNSDIPYC